MSRAVVEVRGREGGDRKSTHDPRTVPEVVILTAQTRCQSIPHRAPDCITKVLAKYGTSITAASLGARALFTTGVGQLKTSAGHGVGVGEHGMPYGGDARWPMRGLGAPRPRRTDVEGCR